MIERAERRIRAVLLSLASNAGLYTFAAFLFMGVLITSPLHWYQDQVQNYFSFIIIPWGMALCLFRLMRRQQNPRPVAADIRALFVLLLWIILPFAYRFGLTYNNINSWCGYAIIFFGIYALIREETPARRASLFNWACAAFCVFAFVYGIALLYCVVTVQTFAADLGDYGFGFYQNMYLCGGIHYNTTAMVAVSTLFMCLAGAERARHLGVKLLYVAGALMMALVVVFTQSRTGRYAMILALALGALSLAIGRLRFRQPMRFLCGLVIAFATAAVLYLGTSALSDAALAHYMRVENQRAAQEAELADEWDDALLFDESDALTEEEYDAEPDEQFEDESPAEPAFEPDETGLVLKARQPMESSFNGRSTIWKNLFRIWRENPKSMVIGSGVGRIGSLVVIGIFGDDLKGITLHNTYLQFIADFGLIGFVLLCVFFLTILRRCLSVYGSAGRTMDGRLSMCMAVAAILITGLMESAPLGELTSMNVVLFFALAMIVGGGRDEQPAAL